MEVTIKNKWPWLAAILLPSSFLLHALQYISPKSFSKINEPTLTLIVYQNAIIFAFAELEVERREMYISG